MFDVFCISAGQIDSKKKNHLFSKKHRYLNYGFLTIASILKEFKYQPIVIHGLFEPPEKIFETCIELGILNSNTPVLLSIPSYFALEWAKELVAIIKIKIPDKKIIVGGRWVVGDNAEWFCKYLNVDLVVPGLVGINIVKIISSYFSDQRDEVLLYNPNNKKIGLNIDYGVLHDRSLFQPSIEVSNGCGMGCSFCEEKDIPLSKLKSASLVADEMQAMILNDNLVDTTPYLESSMFIATGKWANDLIKYRKERGVNVNWRVETRVDKLKVKNIPALAKAGLKVIDLGLESASYAQLSKMKKTNDPKKYLESALTLIKTAYDNGIWVKVNILLYSGETYESIDETLIWLFKIRKYIKGVSVGPVIIYGLNHEIIPFIEELKIDGASPVKSGMKGITYLNLSKEISFEKSNDISKEISREFMTAKDFFDLKSFSYFSRDYRYSDFLSDIKSLKQDEVSFEL